MAHLATLITDKYHKAINAGKGSIARKAYRRELSAILAVFTTLALATNDTMLALVARALRALIGTL